MSREGFESGAGSSLRYGAPAPPARPLGPAGSLVLQGSQHVEAGGAPGGQDRGDQAGHDCDGHERDEARDGQREFQPLIGQDPGDHRGEEQADGEPEACPDFAAMDPAETPGMRASVDMCELSSNAGSD